MQRGAAAQEVTNAAADVTCDVTRAAGVSESRHVQLVCWPEAASRAFDWTVCLGS